MNINSVRIQNFRALFDVEFPISSFSCVIGENNVGKSSLLQALLRFCDGRKLQPTDYYYPDREIIITVELVSITDEDLSSLVEEHRPRIKELLINGSLRLVRRFTPDGSGALRCIKKVSRDERLRPDNVEAFVKGKRGSELARLSRERFPEVESQIPSSPTQSQIKDLID